MKRTLPLLALCLLPALPSQAAEPPRVVADILPVHSLVARVMQGAGEPVLLLPPGADAHGHAMRPSEAQLLESAGLVVWVGPELTPWLERALAALAQDADRLALMDAPGVMHLEMREGAVFGAHDHGAHDDHGHAEEAAHDDHGHAHDGEDPHVWLDPRNAQAMVAAIAEQLAGLDPERAELYAANAAAAQAELRALEEELAATLAPLAGTGFVVLHDAFHYFEARFGVEAAGAVSASDAAAPGAARIAEINTLLGGEGVACIFAEPQQSGALVEQLAAESGARLGLLDPLGAALEPGAGLYPALMRDMAAAMTDCLGGGA
ncbi:zinc ABC transporter solute-binding protein [Halovulum dunhuangense]|uniref:High-affinity zinc uptake system protein ZnuA n=1 Tax=Halovulum dunhuangense TaxID=1505036 RepID=A0A849L496_9RHOB|nr:zinc ABC transporter substrate-binding protein [Halovulum dunhuangense]NNU81159.1 zinc ABC transporter solute-binding protein [Halovulum dunhuangense]